MGELSDRERLVLSLLGEGLFGQEIGEVLGMSGTRVSATARRATARLGARNATEAFRLALETGILPCPRLCQFRHLGTVVPGVGCACLASGTTLPPG